MRRFLLPWSAGIGLLVPLLTSGCQHNRPCCSPCNAPMAASMGAPVAVPSSSPPAAAAPTQTGETVQPAVNALPAVVHTSAKAPPASAADPLLSQAPPPHSTVAYNYGSAQPSLPASDPDETSSARPLFDHDPNYHWLVGTLDYCRIQQAWLLRYAPIDAEDRYGGCVTLVTPGRPTNWKPGLRVRVQGALIDPESQQMRPAFEVQSIRAE